MFKILLSMVLLTLCLSMNNSMAQVMAVLDQGHNTRNAYNTPSENNYTRQMCISAQDEIEPTNGSIIRATLCHNDSAIDVSPFLHPESAAQVPITRKVTGDASNTAWELGKNATHGNYVTDAAYSFDRTVKYVPFQLFHSRQRDKGPPTIPEGPLGELLSTSSDVTLEAMKVLVSKASELDLDVINISLATRVGRDGTGKPVIPRKCVMQTGRNLILAARDLNVMSITGYLNDNIDSTAETWPQCLNGIVKVGNSTASGADEDGIGIGANGGPDYYANGEQRLGSDAREGNSFAAPKVGALFAVLAKEFPRSTLLERETALFRASNRFKTYQGNRARNVRKGDITKAREYLRELYREDEDPSVVIASNDLFITDPTGHGPLNVTTETGVVFSLNFPSTAASSSIRTSQSSSQVNTNSSILSGQRDLHLLVDGTFSGANSTFDVLINGTVVGQLEAGSSGNYKTASMVINREYLFDDSRSSNTILTIQPTVANSNWGIRNIEISYLPRITLNIGMEDNNVYGYLQTPTRYTGLRAMFQVPEEDRDGEGNYQLSATGWDIDLPDETEVFLNGTSIGFLKPGLSSSYAPTTELTLPRSLLLPNRNFVEFVQRRPDASWGGFEDEKWAVKDIRVTSDSLNTLVPIIQLLLEDE